MSAERIIGVDFGTSTSVIRVKRYQDGKPVGGRLEVKPVKFNSGASEIVPTLIGKLSTGGEYYGYEAESGPRNAKTFQNFKVDIESPDEDVRRQARELTAEFFKYLGNTYIDQRSFLGEPDDRLRTIISYPRQMERRGQGLPGSNREGRGLSECGGRGRGPGGDPGRHGPERGP